jgi:hypothetical protein
MCVISNRAGMLDKDQFKLAPLPSQPEKGGAKSM